MGIDGIKGTLADMKDLGIWEPYAVKAQTLKTAIEVSALNTTTRPHAPSLWHLFVCLFVDIFFFFFVVVVVGWSPPPPPPSSLSLSLSLSSFQCRGGGLFQAACLLLRVDDVVSGTKKKDKQQQQ